MTAALALAFERALKRRQNLEEIPGRLDRRIDERFGAELNAARFLQETKREARDDAKHVLAIGAASGKCDRNVLLDVVALRYIGKIDRCLEQRSGECLFFVFRAFDAQRERRQSELLVFK